MSGLWLTEQGGSVVVEVVGTGSPAAAAGLRPGDRLDGGSLGQWIERLSGRPGATIETPYRRDGVVRNAAITLREYL